MCAVFPQVPPLPPLILNKVRKGENTPHTSLVLSSNTRHLPQHASEVSAKDHTWKHYQDVTWNRRFLILLLSLQLLSFDQGQTYSKYFRESDL